MTIRLPDLTHLVYTSHSLVSIYRRLSHPLFKCPWISNVNTRIIPDNGCPFPRALLLYGLDLEYSRSPTPVTSLQHPPSHLPKSGCPFLPRTYTCPDSCQRQSRPPLRPGPNPSPTPTTPDSPLHLIKYLVGLLDRLPTPKLSRLLFLYNVQTLVPVSHTTNCI